MSEADNLRPMRRYSKAQRNADHKAVCLDTSALVRASTQDADVENLSKVQNSRPLKPPSKRSK